MSTPFLPDLTNISAWFVDRPRELAAIEQALRGRKAVVISGEPGTGKSTLARVAADQLSAQFPGGTVFVQARDLQTPREIVARNFRLPLTQRTLLVVDEAELLPPDSEFDFVRLLKAEPRLTLLLTARTSSWRPGYKEFSRVDVGPLDHQQVSELIHRRFRSMDPKFGERIAQVVGGNPLLAQIAASLVAGRIFSPSQLADNLRDFEYSGILGPDGRPVSDKDVDSSPIITDVVSANERLVHLVQTDPDRMYTLSPRQFEELVAEVLSKLGYMVELTPASKDGGFDMYAAKKEALGEFLFLVECKRYGPTNRVGVEIVRALHGVVQQQRANAGIVVTTSFFTSGAEKFQRSVEHQLSLKNYIAVREWLSSTMHSHDCA